MNSYIVGSIADLISQDKGLKKLSKKNKKILIPNTNEQNNDAGMKLPESEEISAKPSKKTKTGVSSSEENIKIKSEKKKSSLKRKSSSNTPDDSISLKKPKKDLLDLDKVPSDSSEDESSTPPEKSTNNLDSNAGQQNKYTDFTEHTIFVGNLPLTFDKHKVCKVFSKFGKIKSARIRCVPIADINMSKKVAAVKKKFNPQRNSLLAYVKYETEDAANAALEANGMVVEGHHLRVDLAEEKKERDLNKAVFVGGLPFNIEDDELWEFFKDCGKIVSVRVVRDSQTSMGKGFGYVNFDSSASVELALQLDGQELKKRKINVKRCRKEKSKNNTFDKRKSQEMVDQLRVKKKEKFRGQRGQKKKEKKQDKTYPNVFQGNTANMKQKKKKKLSKVAKRKRKVMKILGSS